MVEYEGYLCNNDNNIVFLKKGLDIKKIKDINEYKKLDNIFDKNEINNFLIYGASNLCFIEIYNGYYSNEYIHNLGDGFKLGGPEIDEFKNDTYYMIINDGVYFIKCYENEIKINDNGLRWFGVFYKNIDMLLRYSPNILKAVYGDKIYICTEKIDVVDKYTLKLLRK